MPRHVPLDEAIDAIDRMRFVPQKEIWYEWYEVTLEEAAQLDRGQLFEGGKVTIISLGATKDMKQMAYVEVMKGVELDDTPPPPPPVVKHKRVKEKK